MVALVAVVFSPVAVSWYVPSVTDVRALRGKKAQLATPSVDLGQRRARLQSSHCESERRPCGGEWLPRHLWEGWGAADCEGILGRARMCANAGAWCSQNAGLTTRAEIFPSAPSSMSQSGCLPLL
jgi:hypothetical protein